MSGVWFLALAVADVAAARDWYEMQRAGLGDEFLDAIDAAVDSVLTFPDAYSVAYRDARRFLVPRFPYCLYYRVDEDGVVVVACMHALRNPEKHRRRLRG